MRFSVLKLTLTLATGVACSSSTPSTNNTPTKGDAASDEAIPPTKLGHYASPDGFTAFTLDRTGDKPKLQMDKSTDVVELFLEDALDKGTKVGTFLNGPDGRAWLFIGEGGDFIFIPDGKRGELAARDVDRIGVRVSRDADAKPLGAATKVGVASPPTAKTPWDIASEKLTAITVRKKFSQFKPEDSGNLAKVEEALKLVDASMLVRVTAKGAESARWSPASPYIGDVQQGLGGEVGGFPSDKPFEKNGKGLAKFGGEIGGAYIEFGSPSRLKTRTLKGWPPPLAAGTPGVLWMTDSSTLVFVTFDGGRYHLSLPSNPDSEGMPVEMGAGPASGWPAPLQHELVNVDTIRGFAKGSAVPAKTGTDIEAVDDGWWSCVNKTWENGKKEIDKIEATSADMNTKFGKATGVRKTHEQKAEKDCASHKKKLEDALVAFIEARSKERTALYDRVKGRLGSLK
jgi:hypothetical protein